jgi:UDP-N-acetylmuramoyl-tripeptide--D-alanyl-D-alanine ligase
MKNRRRLIMKPITTRTVKEVVKGTLVNGSETQLILNVRTNIEYVDEVNALIFLWEDEEPDLKLIKMYSPCTIVTSKFFEEYKSIGNCAVILVEDAGEAYWSFVRYYRNSFNIPVIAITGTSGKSTIKEMIKQILRSYLRIAGTVGNLNGSGRSLKYLLSIDETTEAAVFETAVGALGELAFACKHFMPTIGIITNIGTYHLDGCGTVENYIKAKAEMVSGLGDKGILILNSDDERIKKIDLKNFNGRIVYFGIKNKAHFQASDIKYGNNRMRFIMNFQNVKYPVSVQGYGEYQVYNVLAAMAAIHELGIGLAEAAKLLASYINLPQHLEILKGIKGATLVDDTWNYNLTGLSAAFKALENIAPGKKRVVMLGGLGKMGEHSEEIITGVGNLIADFGIDNLIITGDTAEAVANAVKERGGKTKINISKDGSGVYRLLKELLNENTVVLIKCYTNEYSKPILDNFQRLIVE